MRRAAIDVGSNSVLLCVAEFTEEGWRPVYESSTVSALGEGTRVSGVIGEEGAVRTLAALRETFDVASRHGAQEIRAAGTMALRLARNAGEFLKRAREQGTPVRLLSGEEEALLGLRSVLDDPTFRDRTRLTVVDVGGHSTEIAVADRRDSCAPEPSIPFRESFPVGTLGLIAKELVAERPSGLDLVRATSAIDATIGMRFLPGECGLVVSLGATGTNLVAIRDEVQPWNPERVHGKRLCYEEVSRFVGLLCSMSLSERARLKGIEPGREKTLHAGALILERCLFALGADSCVVSVRGWRHAWLEGGFREGTDVLDDER